MFTLFSLPKARLQLHFLSQPCCGDVRDTEKKKQKKQVAEKYLRSMLPKRTLQCYVLLVAICRHHFVRKHSLLCEQALTKSHRACNFWFSMQFNASPYKEDSL